MKQNNTAEQQEIANTCPAERCAHTLTLQNYYSAEYNPDGAFPVITICDSSPQIEGASPYANEWQPGNTQYPLEVALAVDYNGNGVRDYDEPVIRAGHEKWYDYGTDHTPSNLEPGYVKGKNDDPNGDDYNAQYNPSGTEGDHRWEPGEKWDDFGLDGVKGTKQQPPGGWKKPGDGYDVGEGDGKFTVSNGLQDVLGSRPVVDHPRLHLARSDPGRRAHRRRAPAPGLLDRRRRPRPLQLRRRRREPRRRLLRARARRALHDGLLLRAGLGSRRSRRSSTPSRSCSTTCPAWSSSAMASSIRRRSTSRKEAASTSARAPRS